MGYGEPIDVACYVWYIEGSGQKILVDAGATSEMFNKRYGAGKHLQSLEEGLSKVGLESKEVDIVILTHLHWDHIALASEFPKAKFIIQKQELDFALNPHPAVAPGYEQELFRGLNFEIIEGDKEVIEGIKALLTPGHTPGGQSVAIQTSEGLAIITGFCSVHQTSSTHLLRSKPRVFRWRYLRFI